MTKLVLNRIAPLLFLAVFLVLAGCASTLPEPTDGDCQMRAGAGQAEINGSTPVWGGGSGSGQLAAFTAINADDCIKLMEKGLVRGRFASADRASYVNFGPKVDGDDDVMLQMLVTQKEADRILQERRALETSP